MCQFRNEVNFPDDMMIITDDEDMEGIGNTIHDSFRGRKVNMNCRDLLSSIQGRFVE